MIANIYKFLYSACGSFRKNKKKEYQNLKKQDT